MKKKKAASNRRPPKRRTWRPAVLAVEAPPRPRIGVVVCVPVSAETDPVRINLLETVERGVRLGGGEPVRLPTSGMWVPTPEFRAVGDEGPDRFRAASAPSYASVLRNLCADEVECLALASGADGLVLVAEGNDAAAGLLLGAARLNKPALMVPAAATVGARRGPGLPGRQSQAPACGKGSDETTMALISEEDEYPGCFVGILAEVMGLTLPGASTAPTASAEQVTLAEAAGRRAVELTSQNFGIRRVLMSNALMNAVRADAAFGGHSNSALFLLALAQEAGVKLSLDAFSELGRRTPQLCLLHGEKGHRLKDMHAAGGVPGLLSALKGQWLPQATVSGRGINELAKAGRVKDGRVIRVREPYRDQGGLLVLRGNLAPYGAFFRPPENFLQKLAVFSGTARVFDSRENALAALSARRVRKGDVLVVRYEGPRGGPGLRSLGAIPRLLAVQGLNDSVALFTDGTWGGLVNAGLAVEMATPEAVEPSALSIVRDGDRITIDVPARRVNAHLTDTDTKVRLARWQAPPARARNGFMARYARSVGTVLEGAVLK